MLLRLIAGLLFFVSRGDTKEEENTKDVPYKKIITVLLNIIFSAVLAMLISLIFREELLFHGDPVLPKYTYRPYPLPYSRML